MRRGLGFSPIRMGTFNSVIRRSAVAHHPAPHKHDIGEQGQAQGTVDGRVGSSMTTVNRTGINGIGQALKAA